MDELLTNDKAFDDYVRRYGWEYDNGGRYAGLSWDWYCGRERDIIVARRKPSSVVVLRFEGLASSEIWSGEIATAEEFDRVMAIAGIPRATE